MRRSLAILLASFFTAGSLQASGFHLYEFGGRASALGGAVVARAWDGSTIFYNPAGLVYLNGTQLYGGATLIFPNSRFVGVAPVFNQQYYDTKDNVFTPINVYFSHNFNGKFAAGIGVANPFGLGVEWYDDFPGRGYSKNAQLQSFYISPVVAYKITPNLSIGGGADFVISKVTLERNVFLFSGSGSPGYEVGEVALEGTSDLGVGFTASAMFRTEKLGLGFTYRHSIHNEFNDGKAEFTIFDNLSVPNAAALAQALLQNQSVSTSIDFPNYFSTGIYYKISNKLGVEADYLWFNWSVFDEIAMNFAEDRLDQTMPEEYQDSWQARLGVHYELSDAISLRAGYAYDRTPQPIQTVSPLLPDDTRHDLSLGMGYNFGKYQIDLGYMLVGLGERSTVENGEGMNHQGFDGTYNSRADLFFANFGISF